MKYSATLWQREFWVCPADDDLPPRFVGLSTPVFRSIVLSPSSARFCLPASPAVRFYLPAFPRSV